MNDIRALTEIDFSSVFLGVFTALAGFKSCTMLLEWFQDKVGLETKWTRQKREDHNLILANTQAIKDLTEVQKKDKQISNEHDEKIREDLSAFMMEVRTDIKEFAENRIHDREQSRKIQKELSDSIKAIIESQKSRDEQVEALMCGNKELLGNTIDELYSRYIELDGIPESEVDEFDDIFHAYKGLNGNHRRDSKYEYVKKHLKVIPVETKLVIKHEKE